MSSDDPTLEDGASSAAPGVGPGGTIGRFAIDGVLGSGGMGLVLRAHDPTLGREVAVKLLRPDQLDDDGAERLLREAQAMARLSHPNVVTVYEVGADDAQPFVAMELVEGTTLRAWLRERARPWSEVVPIFVAVGRGLAAVHAAGLVHRDVKPENVLIGRDGRPRLGDFGLVDRAGGTPAYMSPEQKAGGAIDARSDQYSFAVAFRESLRDAPGWLEAILARGAAADPDARWPSVEALLDAIDRRLGGRRRAARAVGLVAVALGAGLGVAVVTADQAPAVCPAPTARVAAVWSPARAGALAEHLAAIDPARGAERAAAAAAAFERDVGAWSAMAVEACRANHGGAQSDTLLDLRARCLERRLAELDGTIDRLEQATTPAALDQAVLAIGKLSPLSVCADADALAARLTPPADPAARAEADAIDALLQEIELDDRIGEVVRERAEAVVARARALGHPPSLSAALGVLASAQLRDQDAAVALATLEELVEVAARARDDRAAAHAWTRILRVQAIERAKPEIATAMIPVATAAVARAGDQPAQRINLMTTVAGFLASQGQDERALALLDEAAALLPALADVDPTLEAAVAGVVAYTRVGPLLHLSRSEEAIATVERARAIWERELGPDHPFLAAAYGALAGAHRQLGRLDEALALLRKMVAVEERRGAGPPLVFALTSLGSTLIDLDRDAEALEVLERTVALARETLPPEAPQRIAPLGHLGAALNEAGRRDEALAVQDEAVAIATATGARSHQVAALYHNRAQTLLAMERWADAAAGFRAALALFEELRGADSPETIESRIGLGEALLGAGDRAAAVEALERAIAIPAEAQAEKAQARAREILARAR